MPPRAFETAFHGATMKTSSRERIVRALDRFRTLFGRPPRVHANHSFNRDNLYWGAGRFDALPLRLLYRTLYRQAPDFYQGHTPASPDRSEEGRVGEEGRSRG